MEIANKTGKDERLDCPSIEIAAYLDGELSPDDELRLEAHFAFCEVCSEELNVQKLIVNVLSGSLDSVPELPKDFAKVVVASAESSVGGLRKSSERTSAMFVFAALFFVVLFTLGASAPGAFAAFFNFAGGIYTVFAFIFHFIFDVGEGIVILLRAFLSQPASSASLAIAAILVACAAGFFIFQSRSTNRRDHIEGESVS